MGWLSIVLLALALVAALWPFVRRDRGALQFLVAALQAYIFAMLTSIYLSDAIHPGSH